MPFPASLNNLVNTQYIVSFAATACSTLSGMCLDLEVMGSVLDQNLRMSTMLLCAEPLCCEEVHKHHIILQYWTIQKLYLPAILVMLTEKVFTPLWRVESDIDEHVIKLTKVFTNEYTLKNMVNTDLLIIFVV